MAEMAAKLHDVNPNLEASGWTVSRLASRPSRWRTMTAIAHALGGTT